MDILVQIKSVYGQDKIYPVCGKAKTFAEMVGQQMLTHYNIAHIKKLGFAVNVMPQEKIDNLICLEYKPANSDIVCENDLPF